MDSRRILVTGGAGFIGSNLCRELLDRGHQVVCLDNLVSGRLKNIRDLRGREGFTFMEADVTKRGLFDDFEPVDYLFNLACPASPPFYQNDPVGTFKTCVLGAINSLELAKRFGARILLASTSEIYGDPLEHPQREDYRGNVSTSGIRACYDEGKRASETLFFDYHRQHDVDVRVVRIFNTYGPGMRSDDGRVVSNFIRQALKGEPITIFGDGKQTRSFCYVDDMVQALVAMMDQDEFIGPVNLGNPDERTMEELAELAAEQTGSSSEIVYMKLPEDDPLMRRPDITVAKEKLGWAPTTSLEEGIAKTVAYFRDELGL